MDYSVFLNHKVKNTKSTTLILQLALTMVSCRVLHFTESYLIMQSAVLWLSFLITVFPLSAFCEPMDGLYIGVMGGADTLSTQDDAGILGGDRNTFTNDETGETYTKRDSRQQYAGMSGVYAGLGTSVSNIYFGIEAEGVRFC